MLESKGYHCTAVSNGRAAQDQVKRTTPDLVLSDMIMPEMDGIKLLEWLRQYDPEVPRSEEHTSELQSHSDLVCRLLLEKKKKRRRLNALTTARAALIRCTILRTEES